MQNYTSIIKFGLTVVTFGLVAYTIYNLHRRIGALESETAQPPVECNPQTLKRPPARDVKKVKRTQTEPKPYVSPPPFFISSAEVKTLPAPAATESPELTEDQIAAVLSEELASLNNDVIPDPDEAIWEEEEEEEDEWRDEELTDDELPVP